MDCPACGEKMEDGAELCDKCVLGQKIYDEYVNGECPKDTLEEVMTNEDWFIVL